MEIRILDGGQFAALSRRLRDAGAKDLQREMGRGIDRSVKPLIKAVMAAPPKYLPDNYAAGLGLKVKVRKRAAGRNPRIRLVGEAVTPNGSPRQLGRLNRGQLKHMLFGDAEFWFSQKVKPKFWDEPLEESTPLVHKELLRVLRDIARKVAGR